MRFLNFFGSNGLMLLMLFPPVIGLEGVCGGEGVSWFSDEGSYLIYKMRASTLFFYIFFLDQTITAFQRFLFFVYYFLLLKKIPSF